jgi:26S proteasome regulatory subunit T5
LWELSFVVEFEERRRKMALPMNEADIFEDVNDELAGMTPEDILRRSRLLENEIRVLKVRVF